MKSDSSDSSGFDANRLKIRLKSQGKTSSSRAETKTALTFFRIIDRLSGNSYTAGRVGVTGGKAWRRNQKGKGAFARSAGEAAQRVVVKTRVVRHPADGKSLRAFKLHLGYLTRPGVEREGPERSRCYNENGPLEKKELDLWAENLARDRHHFRFIVSPEKARELDLNRYSVELVKAMERDLGTGLDFVAVNHYNTDNPHVHLIVRGKNDQNKDLVLGRDYIASGIRNRARELATLWLGKRSELEIRDGMIAEIKLERLTGIDRELLYLQGKSLDRTVDLRVPDGHENSIAGFHRNVRKQRFLELKRLGLAEERAPGVWHLKEETEHVLRELGTQRDIIKTMHKSLGRETNRELVIFDSNDDRQLEVRGIVLDRGVSDELRDKKYLVIAGEDERAYYVGLSRFSELEGVEASPGSRVRVAVKRHELEPRVADRTILELAGENGGVYDQTRHLERVDPARLPPGVTSGAYLENHLRRLGSLERNGLVRKLDEGRWLVPHDLRERMYEMAQEKGLHRQVEVRLEAPIRVPEQVPTLEHKLGPKMERNR